ncbi:MAG: hypothetical protein JO062_07810 [Bryobacterales bacterium]|nr:hypothetical protein [Bryobacterales bacterium]
MATAPLLNAQVAVPGKLSLRVELIGNEIANARSVQVRTEIKNVSGQDVSLLLSSPQDDFTFTVVGPDGTLAAMTRRAEARPSTVPNGSHILVTLPPQQAITRICSLSDIIDFSRPGTYRVAVSRRFEAINETQVSNTIEVKIP